MQTFKYQLVKTMKEAELRPNLPFPIAVTQYSRNDHQGDKEQRKVISALNRKHQFGEQVKVNFKCAPKLKIKCTCLKIHKS